VPLLSGWLSAIQGGKSTRRRLSNNRARTVEMTYAAERFLTIARNPEILGPNIRNLATATTRFEWLWSRHREAAVHYYEADEAGLVTPTNLIVAVQIKPRGSWSLSTRARRRCSIPRRLTVRALLI